MAYLPPDEELRQQQLAALTTSAGGGTPSGGGSSAGQPAPAASNSGSGWTNLQDFLSANQAGAQQMGQGIAGDLSAKAQDASAPALAAPTVTEDYTSTHTTTPQMTDAQRQEAKDASQAFGFFQGGQGSPDAQSGRQGYLDQQYGKQGGYSQGMSGLDSYLLGGAGMQPIQAAWAQWQDPLAKAQSYQPTDTTTFKQIPIDKGIAANPVTRPPEQTHPPQGQPPGTWEDRGDYTWDPTSQTWVPRQGPKF